MANTVTLKQNSFMSKPLFKQSFKSNWVLWLIMTLGSAFIFIIINFAIGTKQIFTNIDMATVSVYVQDEGMSWLQILGLLEKMGFSLSRIEVMSQIDLNSVMSELIYKIAGVLLPMVFIMITANKLIAAQVSDGSMAYVLSTPTNRKTVVRTQYIFLLVSIIAMYLVITVAALSSEGIAHAILVKNMRMVNPNFDEPWIPTRTLLYCLGSFVAMFGLLGICFGASAWFNKSKNSTAVGGGVCIVSFLACILGLFGNEVFVAVGVGVKGMYAFNYLSLFTLVDTDSMSKFAKSSYEMFGVDPSYDWIWKLCILLVIGVVFAFVGARRFVKKDLPL